MYIIFFSKSINTPLFMEEYPPFKVRNDTYIKRAIFLRSNNVDVRIFHSYILLDPDFPTKGGQVTG